MESQSGPRRWRIEPVKKDGEAGENYKVVFMHNGAAYELGLFSTREEGTRVADVLTSESAPIPPCSACWAVSTLLSQLALCACHLPTESVLLPLRPHLWVHGSARTGESLESQTPCEHQGNW